MVDEINSVVRGDVVQVTLVGKEWGTGTVLDISTYDHGGSRLFPVFLVNNDTTGQKIWVPLVSIKRVA